MYNPDHYNSKKVAAEIEKKAHELGIPVYQLCSRTKTSYANFCVWKRKTANMETKTILRYFRILERIEAEMIPPPQKMEIDGTEGL